MSDAEPDPLHERLSEWVGRSLSRGPAVAPDAVNLPMIRHWVDALDDRNPVYLDEEAAARTRHGGIVAPGLCVMGLPHQRTARSVHIDGAPRDAKALARQIVHGLDQPLAAVHAANAIDRQRAGDDLWDGLDRDYLERLGLLDRVEDWMRLCARLPRAEGTQ